MRAADLPITERRLLRHLKRIDPNPSVTLPREWEAAESLRRQGLAERIGGPHSPRYAITDAGRSA